MANVVISAGTLADEYVGDETVLHLRVYVSATFVDADNVTVMRSNYEQGSFYKTVICTVIDGIVYYPGFTVPSNVDALADPDRSKYMFALFQTDGRLVQAVAKRLRIPPTPNPTTIALITQYSSQEGTPPPADPDYYTNAELDAIFANHPTDAEMAAAITAAIDALIGGAPDALDTLEELAAALANDEDFAATVAAALPPVGGTTGQVLAKSSNVNYAYIWTTIVGLLPAGGTAGQVLSKINGTDFNAQWVTPPASVVPPGGTAGQHLSKVDGADFNTQWVDDINVSYNGAIQHTTASIADEASVSEAIANIGKSFIINKVTVSRACRLRIYNSAAARDADAARLVGVAPDTDEQHLLALEYIFEIGDLTKYMNAIPTVVNAESPRTNDTAIHVTNMSGFTGTVVIDIEAVILEV